MLRLRLVAFDLDGTLLDSAPDLARAAELMARDLGLPPPSRARVGSWVGDGVRRLVKRVLSGTRDGEPPVELYRRGFELFRRYYREHLADGTRLYPGVREVLGELRASGLYLACVTNKATEFTAPLLAAFDLEGFFHTVVAGDTLTERKPDPAPLRYAAATLGVAPAAACMVGDSVNDIRAARGAGFAAVAVTYGYGDAAELAAAAPDALLSALVELPTWLAGRAPGLAGCAASR